MLMHGCKEGQCSPLQRSSWRVMRRWTSTHPSRSSQRATRGMSFCAAPRYSDLRIELENFDGTCWNRASRSRRQKLWFRDLDANPRYPSPRAQAGRSARVFLDYRPVCRDHDSRNRRNRSYSFPCKGPAAPCRRDELEFMIKLYGVERCRPFYGRHQARR